MKENLKRTGFILGMIIFMLSFSLLFVGCDTEETRDDNETWSVAMWGQGTTNSQGMLLYATRIVIVANSNSGGSNAKWKKTEIVAEDVLNWLNIDQGNNELSRHESLQGSLTFDNESDTVMYLSFTCAHGCLKSSSIHLDLKDDAATLSAIKDKLVLTSKDKLDINNNRNRVVNVRVTNR
jgi:hypothetical protein